MNNVFLLENHDEVLRIWREKNIKGLDLVHLDAHIDFSFYLAKPIDKIFTEAKSVKELKQKLEYSISFSGYEKDFNKQINIGNYIYPAIEEGIINDFYWVIPGSVNEFKNSTKIVKNILKEIVKQESNKAAIVENGVNGIISAKCLGRKFIVCNLENLPIFNKDVLLDIDTDFLVIDSVKNADNTKNIGKRNPWIFPENLVKILNEKIKNPKVTTIAYSVNGGWTPIKYKHFADELAYYFQPSKFKRHFEINKKAAIYFNLFESTSKRKHYQRAIKLNPTYRLADNNYGPIYLSSRKIRRAKEEFNRVLSVDKNNPAAFLGLGAIALEEKEFLKAKRYFHSALHSLNNDRLFRETKKQCLYALGKTEFYLKNFKQAKKLLFSYKNISPLEPRSYYILGSIFQKEKRFSKAAIFYKDAIRLGFGKIEPLFKLLKISRYLSNKDSIIQYVIAKHKNFKKAFIRLEGLSKRDKKIKGLPGIKKKILFLEEKLANF